MTKNKKKSGLKPNNQVQIRLAHLLSLNGSHSQAQSLTDIMSHRPPSWNCQKTTSLTSLAWDDVVVVRARWNVQLRPRRETWTGPKPVYRLPRWLVLTA
jgi:hypothetical protein